MFGGDLEDELNISFKAIEEKALELKDEIRDISEVATK